LDRFTSIPRKYDIQEFGIQYGKATCFSPDGTFWIAEINPQRLKKYDPLRNIVIHEVQHNLGDSISKMRTFGSLLLIANEKGLHILDQFGNLNGTVHLKGVSYFQIINNLVLVTHQNGFTSIDPFRIEVLESNQSDTFLDKLAIMKLDDEFVTISEYQISFYTKHN
jgi:hypothetical protein